MNTIEDLREWAGVADDSQDDTLRKIEAGVVALLERATNRLFPCPPEKATEVLNGPPQHTGGLTQLDPGPQQWVTLREEPYIKLTGTFTITAGSALVVGTGTKATEELSASPPTAIVFDGGDPMLVKSITDDTNFELEEAHEDGVSGVAATADLIGLETREDGSSTWTELDPTDFEMESSKRRVYSLDGDFEVGRRTVRVTYRRGFEEGEGPDDVSLLVLEMVKSSYVRKRRRSNRVSVSGGFSITWASFKDEAGDFMKKAKLLERGLTFG